MSAQATAHPASVALGPRIGGHQWPAAFLGVGAALLAVGGQLHPHDAKATMTDTLIGLLTSPVREASHLLIIAGVVSVVVGLAGALTVALVCWAVALVDLVPHLLAGSEHEALGSPLVGLSSAVLAIAVARAARTWPARLLAVAGAAGGAAFAVASPLVAGSQDPRSTALFAADALIALWLVGTALRLLLGQRAVRRA
jgi:hypothetical protein